MSNQNKKCFSLQSLADEVVTRPAPESCEEIARLLSDLPLWSSFINKTPKPEQKRAYELLTEKSASPTPEEILFMAEIGCGKYHKIRQDGDCDGFASAKAKELYKRYYELTGSEEVKYILNNFDDFANLCYRSYSRRRNRDDRAALRENATLSTSRDPDSEEWKK